MKKGEWLMGLMGIGDLEFGIGDAEFLVPYSILCIIIFYEYVH